MMLEFSSMSERIARKNHICDLCGEVITIGEKYNRYSGKYEGEMFDMKHHLMCREIIYQFCDDTDSCEYTESEILEWLQEKICYECEHSWHGDGKDDCDTSLFQCPRVIERFAAKDGEGND